MSSTVGIISSSSKKGRPPSVAPIFPLCRNETGERRSGQTDTYNNPQNALQLEYELGIVAFVAVESYELRKLRKVPFLLQNLAPEIGLGHFAIEMWRNGALKSTGTALIKMRIVGEEGFTVVLRHGQPCRGC